MLVLSVFHVSQGMEDIRIFDAGLKAEIEAYDPFYANLDPLQDLEQQRDETFQTLILNLKLLSEREKKEFQENKAKFREVIYNIEDMYIVDSERERDANLLDTKREEVWQAFKRILKSEASEAIQGCDLPEGFGLGQAFEVLFTPEQIDNQACENLFKSIAGMETLRVEEKIETVEEQVDVTVTIEPIVVGWGTWLKDKIFGASNLISELKTEKLPLKVLIESPDMQKRINNMIASYSPNEKSSQESLQALEDIYTSLNQMRFKFVDVEVNSAIHNTCEKLQRDSEAQAYAKKKAVILNLAKLIVSEAKKMDMLNVENVPQSATIEKLKSIQALSLKAGQVQGVTKTNEQKDTSAPKISDMVSRLKELSEALIQEDEFKGLFA